MPKYIIILLLCYCHISSWTAQAQNGAFMVTKINTNEAVCVLTGEATRSGVAWTTSANQTTKELFKQDAVPVYYPLKKRRDLDCSFEGGRCVNEWISRFWKQGISFEFMLSPRTDSAWNGFKMLHTSGRYFGDIPQENKFPILCDYGLSISISVKVASNAHVIFCDSYYFTSARCYMVILAGFAGSRTSVIRKCVHGMPAEFAMEDSCSKYRASVVHHKPLVDDRLWKHFTFVLKKTYGGLELEVFAKNDENSLYEPILNYNDESQPIIYVNYFGVRSYIENGLWKIHDYKFLTTTSATSLGILHSIKPESLSGNKTDLCLKMAIAQCDGCSFQLNVLDGKNIRSDSNIIYGPELDRHNIIHWKEETFVIPLSELKYSRQVTLHYTTNPDSKRPPFWMIDDVRECVVGETKILTYNDPGQQGADVLCQILDDTLIQNEENSGRILASTSLMPPDCSIWYNHWRSCYGIRKTNANGQYGECYPGYNGPYCQKHTVLDTDLEIISPNYNNFIVKPKTFKATGTTADYMEIQYQYFDTRRSYWENIGGRLSISTYMDEFTIPHQLAGSGLLEGKLSVRILLYVEKNQFIVPEPVIVIPTCTKPKDLMFSSDDKSITITTKSEVRSGECPLAYYLLNVSYSRASIVPIEDRDKHYIKIKNLEPFTEYIIYFQGRQGENFAEKYNTTEAAPGRVIEFQAYSAESDSISLRWKPPEPAARGILQYYSITYYINNVLNMKNVTQESRCSIWEEYTCTTISGLKEDATYNIWIQAYNRNPKPGQVVQISLQAKQGRPSKPVDLLLKNNIPTEISWKHPWLPNGKITLFEIECELKSTYLRNRPKNHVQIITNNIIKDMKEYSYTLTSLSPASEYKIKVTAQNKNYGTPAEINIMTPLVPPSIVGELQVNNIANERMQITIPGAKENVTEESGLYVLISETNSIRLANEKRNIQTQQKLKFLEIWKTADVIENDDTISWIAKHIKNIPEDDIQIVIGANDDMTPEVYNGPLSEESTYRITILYYNKLNEEERYTVLFSSKILDKESNYALWSLLFLLLIPIIAYVYIKGRRNQKTHSNTTDDSDQYLHLRNRSPSETMKHYGSKISLVKSFSRSQSQMTHPVDLSNFENYVKESLYNGELEKQHAMFKRGLLRSVSYGKQKENKFKNRYINLIPYEHTRVVLDKIPGAPYSDYINANYIDGYERPNEYIATQGPKKNTVNDFWRMVWQKKVTVICMLTNTVERNKDKCYQYWPLIEGAQEQYGDITVHHVSSMVYADFVYRTLNICLGGTNYIVEHLHFTSWPDHGVPQYAESVVTFIHKFQSVPSDLGPKLVHCSAGVGRTGTIILADICLKMAQDVGKIDVLYYQSKIREQRANLVDNKDQYKLVHMILVESLFGEPTGIPCSDLKIKIKEMRSNNSLLEKLRNLDKHFWKDNFIKSSEDETAIEITRRKEDRNNIIPGVRNRVFLPRFPVHVADSDYINAVYVDGFRVKDQFIVTQFPLAHTVADYWRMISDKEITLVAVLNEIDITDETVQCFVPNESLARISPIPEISVEYQKQRQTELCFVTSVLLRDKTKPGEDISRNVTVVQLKNWSSNQLLPNWKGRHVECLLTLWDQLEKLTSGPEPILITCYDGATGCGLFSALTFVIEKIKLEHECDVPLAVRTVRRHRQEMLRSEEQFEFLYDAAMHFLDGFDTYANFRSNN